MLKRISLPILMALLFTLMFSSTALAADGPPTERIRVRGEIVSVHIGAGTFQLKTGEGKTLTFFVSDNTRYLGKAQSLAELQAGWKAGVAGRKEGGRYLAAAVFAVELKDRPDLSRHQGEVTAVDAGAGKFRLQTRDGAVLTFFVHEKTRYGGQLESLKDLSVGWQAGVGALESEGGQLNAAVVIAGERRERPNLEHFRGEIKAVSPGPERFQLETPDGEVLVVFVGERTRYIGQADGFEDLEQGWKAGVAAYRDEDGNLQAVGVAAGDREEMPDGLRVRGAVTAVDAEAGKFRLENRDGEVLTFFVRERTRYRGQLDSLGDLEVGWQVGVGGFEDEDGRLQALVVIAGEPRGENSGGGFSPPGPPPGRPNSDF